jgi:hypothetical protein
MSTPELCDATKSVFDQNYRCIYRAVIVSATLLALGSFVVGMKWRNDPSAHRTCKESLYAIWVLGPPIWFFFEYFYLFRQHGKPGCIDTFKYGQELASRIWLALVAVLGVLFFGKELIGKG